MGRGRQLLEQGLDHQRAGRAEAAIAAYQEALRRDDGLIAAHVNLGVLLLRQRRDPEAAEACFRRALRVQPTLADAHANLGNALMGQGRFAEAEAAYRQAITSAPARRVDFLPNLGNALLRQGCFAAAEGCFREVLQVTPGAVDVVHNLALLLLVQGRYAEGWPLWEARFHEKPRALSPQRFTAPRWRGEPMAGETLLVWGEQGYGDLIQFVRYFPLLRATLPATRLLYPCPSALTRLLTPLARDAGVTLLDHEPVTGCDRHIPLLSLPGLLGTRLETIPATPYLAADPALAAIWRQRLRDGIKVGLVWRGNPTFKQDRLRSLPSPALLAPLFALPGLRFFTLVKSLQAGETAFFAAFPQVEHLDEALGDFAETAGVVACLDLVISVDTAVAHLAGAMGKPVWLLNRYDSDWRWFWDREDSPWYPSLRLFRQQAPGDWDGVMVRVREALASR